MCHISQICLAKSCVNNVIVCSQISISLEWKRSSLKCNIYFLHTHSLSLSLSEQLKKCPRPCTYQHMASRHKPQAERCYHDKKCHDISHDKKRYWGKEGQSQKEGFYSWMACWIPIHVQLVQTTTISYA